MKLEMMKLKVISNYLDENSRKYLPDRKIIRLFINAEEIHRYIQTYTSLTTNIYN